MMFCFMIFFFLKRFYARKHDTTLIHVHVCILEYERQKVTNEVILIEKNY